jgi:MYXO-CTERM domain-containing protein
MSTGTASQNDIQILLALFGPKGAVAPTLTVTNPSNGSAQVPGFTITADCSSSDGVQEVDVSIDGLPKATLMVPPYSYATQASLTEGPHKVSVLCASKLQAITTVTADIIVGAPCNNGSCETAGYLCFDGACIAGPDTAGGVGATCTNNSDCIAGACASDGSTMACTIPCDLEAKNCPDDFGCIDTGGGAGVCWPGAGGGCCDTSGGNGAGSMLLALAIAATFVTRRRRRGATT